jgi:3-deoxy-D-manno-octulosonate 8-phosphate phosphatase (KDO 8-P phosphatase)
MTRISKSLTARLAKIKIFLCDVDGVLTDGIVTIGGDSEYKRFFIQDGLGMLFLKRNGIKVGWVSARPSAVTQKRAAELKIDYLHQEDVLKVQAVQNLLDKAGFTWEEASYMGDDIVDIGVIKRVGVGVAVANAIEEAKAVARYVTQAPGGQGAVREVARMILVAQNKWQPLVEHFTE